MGKTSYPDVKDFPPAFELVRTAILNDDYFYQGIVDVARLEALRRVLKGESTTTLEAERLEITTAKIRSRLNKTVDRFIATIQNVVRIYDRDAEFQSMTQEEWDVEFKRWPYIDSIGRLKGDAAMFPYFLEVLDIAIAWPREEVNQNAKVDIRATTAPDEVEPSKEVFEAAVAVMDYLREKGVLLDTISPLDHSRHTTHVTRLLQRKLQRA